MQTLLGCLLVFLVLLQQDGSCVQELMAKEWRRGPASSIAHSTLLLLIYAGNTAPHPFTLGDCQDSPAIQEATLDQAQTGGLVYVALATRLHLWEAHIIFPCIHRASARPPSINHSNPLSNQSHLVAANSIDLKGSDVFFGDCLESIAHKLRGDTQVLAGSEGGKYTLSTLCRSS